MRTAFKNRLAATVAAAALSVAGCQFPTDGVTPPTPAQLKPPQGFQPPAPKPPPPFPKPVAMPLDPALDARAMDEVTAALSDRADEVRRAHGLEAVQSGRLADAARHVLPGLDDPSPRVAKVAALVAGQLRLRAATPRLLALADPASIPGGFAAADADAAQEHLAVLYALHRLGDVRYSHEFEAATTDGRVGVRRDAAFVLGRLGNPSAVPLLSEMLRRDKDPNVRLEAAEALWRLGDEHGQDVLIETLVSRYASDRLIALLALAGPRDQRVLGNVESELTDDYPEVCLVAARAAGELGSMDGYGVAIAGAKSPDPRQRALAAFAFAGIGRADCQPTLAALLSDPVAEVRMAAAAAVLELNAPPERR